MANVNSCESEFNNCELKLFGAFISGVSANHSWGDSGTSLSVSLIEEPVCEGEEGKITFCPPKLGSPVCLDLSCVKKDDVYDSEGSSSYEGWQYLGLLDSWDITEDADAGKRIEVRLVDPVQIMSGYQLILSGYDGQTFGVRNLCNLYGFLLSANGPQILARTLDECGCELDFDDEDPYCPTDPTIENPHTQRLIYPSEFLDREGKLRRDVDTADPTNVFVDYLYDKVGLKWHTTYGDMERDFLGLSEIEIADYFFDGTLPGGTTALGDSKDALLAEFNEAVQTQDEVTREIFRRKFWDGSEESDGGIPAILILQSLRGLFTGGLGREESWKDFDLVDYPTKRGWDNIEEIKDWRCFPEREGVNGQVVPAQVPVWEFWQPPKWRDHFYLIDFTELEQILIDDADFGLSYKIQGEKISLLEFVDKVCSDLGYDWQFVLEVNKDINSTNLCATYSGGCEGINCLQDDEDFSCYYYDPYPNTADGDPYASGDGLVGSGLTIRLKVFKITQEEEGMARALDVEGNAYTDCVNVRGADKAVDANIDAAMNLLGLDESFGLTNCPKPLSGELKRAVDAASGAGSRISTVQVGVEHSKEPKNAFVIGDKVRTLHQVIFRETDDPTAATIWPYWGDRVANHHCVRGYGSDGIQEESTNQDLINDMTIMTPIAGRGVGDLHHFDVDCAGWDVFEGVLVDPDPESGGFGGSGFDESDPYGGDSLDTYRITVMELKAALVSQDAWMSFYTYAALIAASPETSVHFEIRDVFKDHDVIKGKLEFPTGRYFDWLINFVEEDENSPFHGKSLRTKKGVIGVHDQPINASVEGSKHPIVRFNPLDIVTNPALATTTGTYLLLKKGFEWMRNMNNEDAPNSDAENPAATADPKSEAGQAGPQNPEEQTREALKVVHSIIFGGGGTGREDDKNDIYINPNARKLKATLEGRRDRLYKEVKKIADEYYGKKFIVPLPFICGYLPGEHGSAPGEHNGDGSDPYDNEFKHFFDVKTNWEETDSGWCEAESVLGLPNISHNEIGFEKEKISGSTNDGLMLFKEKDGKIGCFVRYNCAEVLDLTDLDRQDYILESEGDGNASGPVWIKAEVEKIMRSVDDTVDPYGSDESPAALTQSCEECDPYDPYDNLKDKMKYSYNADSDNELSYVDANEEVNAESIYSKEPFTPAKAHHTESVGTGESLSDSGSDASDDDSGPVTISCFPTYSHDRMKYYGLDKGMGYLENIKRKVPWTDDPNEYPSADRLMSLPTTFGFGYLAVITVPGSIVSNQDVKDQSTGYYMNAVTDLLYVADTPEKIELTQEQKQELKDLLDEKVQYEKNISPEGQEFFVPAAVAIPLVSNVHSYGPYYSQMALHNYPFWGDTPRSNDIFADIPGAKTGQWEHLGGATEVIRNTSLNPWSYGDIHKMHIAGHAEAASARSQLFVSEQGSITAIGLPEADLGDGVLALVHNITGKGEEDGGPIITDIRVQRTPDQGIRTTYGFKTHFKRFGVIEKIRIAQLQRISSHRNAKLKDIYNLMRGGKISRGTFGRIHSRSIKPYSHIYSGIESRRANDYKAISTKDFLFSDAKWAHESEVWEEDLTFNHPAIGTYLNESLAQLRIDHDHLYTAKAGSSPEGLIRPFDTRDNGYSLSAFKNMEDATWDGDESDSKKIATDDPESFNMFFSQEQVPPVDNEYNMPITVNTLNPFKSDADANKALFGFKHMNDSLSKYHDIEFVVRGDCFPTDMSVRTEYNRFLNEQDGTATEGNPEGAIQHDQSYRAISLRGPLIVTGWGFDIHNNPVPAQLTKDGHPQSEGSNCKRFLHDWLRKPHTWKTGPVDLRWDEDRGVWSFPQMKLVQVSLCECLDRKHDSSALGRVVGEEQQTDKNCEPVLPKKVHCTTSEDVCEFESGQSNDEQTITVYNRTGKVVTPATKVMAYFDTVHRKYYVITAPDPLFMATVDNINVDGEKIKLIQPNMTDGQATIYEALDDAEFPEACNGNLVQIKNSLRQPICAGQRVLVRLTETVEESKGANCNLKGEVLQAEFEPLCVVTSVDCYENSNGEPTLEICDRLVYLQTAWTIEDCGDDEEDIRRDTKGWNPDGDRANENKPFNIETAGANAEFDKATDDGDGDGRYDPRIILPKREDHWECAKADKEEESE